MGEDQSRPRGNQNYDYQRQQQQYYQNQQQQRQSAPVQAQQFQQQQMMFQQQQARISQPMPPQVQAPIPYGGQQYQHPQNQQQYQQMYRTWRQSVYNKSGGKGDAPNDDLKNFYMKVCVHKDTLKTRITDDHKIQLSFKVDALCDAHIRVNTCVTEKKNPNNAPEMFYTPNRDDYIQQVSVKTGIDQDIPWESVSFDLNYLAAFELTKSVKDYHPIIISMNYSDGPQQYAMMSYATFIKNGNGDITGAHIDKQVVLINGLPFEIKSIYGMTNEEDAVEGENAIADDSGDPESECLICLSERKDTLIMPCCHLCVCGECGKQLVAKKHTCPICRGNIQSLIPMKKHI